MSKHVHGRRALATPQPEAASSAGTWRQCYATACPCASGAPPTPAQAEKVRKSRLLLAACTGGNLGRDGDDVLPLPVLDQVQTLQRRDNVLTEPQRGSSSSSESVGRTSVLMDVILLRSRMDSGCDVLTELETQITNPKKSHPLLLPQYLQQLRGPVRAKREVAQVGERLLRGAHFALVLRGQQATGANPTKPLPRPCSARTQTGSASCHSPAGVLVLSALCEVKKQAKNLALVRRQRQDARQVVVVGRVLLLLQRARSDKRQQRTHPRCLQPPC